MIHSSSTIVRFSWSLSPLHQTVDRADVYAKNQLPQKSYRADSVRFMNGLFLSRSRGVIKSELRIIALTELKIILQRKKNKRKFE